MAEYRLVGLWSKKKKRQKILGGKKQHFVNFRGIYKMKIKV